MNKVVSLGLLFAISSCSGDNRAENNNIDSIHQLPYQTTQEIERIDALEDVVNFFDTETTELTNDWYIGLGAGLANICIDLEGKKPNLVTDIEITESIDRSAFYLGFSAASNLPENFIDRYCSATDQ
jgi:hypothetical protein